MFSPGEGAWTVPPSSFPRCWGPPRLPLPLVWYQGRLAGRGAWWLSRGSCRLLVFSRGYFFRCWPPLLTGSGLGTSDAPLAGTSLDPSDHLALSSLDQRVCPVSPGMSLDQPAEPPVIRLSGWGALSTWWVFLPACPPPPPPNALPLCTLFFLKAPILSGGSLRGASVPCPCWRVRFPRGLAFLVPIGWCPPPNH